MEGFYHLPNLPTAADFTLHIYKNDGFSFRARTGIVVPSSGGDFGLAINADNSNLGAGAAWASDLSFDTTYRVVISWNAGTGESNLWLDPADESSTNISHTGGFTGDLIEAFAFRQSNDYTGSQVVDNLLVGSSFGVALNGIPEPSSMVLMVLGGLTLFSLGRRSVS